MINFNHESGREMSSAISGKTVSGVDIPESGMDDYLVFKFTDGTELRLRYDWIYEWEVGNTDVA